MGRSLLIVGIICLLLGLCIGFPVGKSCSPQVKIGQTTVIDSIVCYDTVINYKDTGSIKVTQKVTYVPKYVYVDSSKKSIDTVKVKNIANCYSFDQVEKDGVYIKAELCSDSFPKVKPLDLLGSITYLPHPDTTKHIMRVDTVMRNTSVPIMKDWHNYALVILAAILAGTFIHK